MRELLKKSIRCFKKVKKHLIEDVIKDLIHDDDQKLVKG